MRSRLTARRFPRCCLVCQRRLLVGATQLWTLPWTSLKERNLVWQIQNKVLSNGNYTQANALKQDWQPFVITWVAFQGVQSSCSGSKFLFVGCDKIEQEHELEKIEEEYKATEDDIAQIMLIKSLIKAISGTTSSGLHRRTSPTLTKNTSNSRSVSHFSALLFEFSLQRTCLISRGAPRLSPMKCALNASRVWEEVVRTNSSPCTLV